MLILFSVSLLTCQNLQFKGHIRVLFLQDHSLVFKTEVDFFQDSINYVHFSLVPTVVLEVFHQKLYYSIKLFENSECNLRISETRARNPDEITNLTKKNKSK